MFIDQRQLNYSKISYLTLNGPFGQPKKLIRNDLWINNPYQWKNPSQMLFEVKRQEITEEDFPGFRARLSDIKQIYDVWNGSKLVYTTSTAIYDQRQGEEAKDLTGDFELKAIEWITESFYFNHEVST